MDQLPTNVLISTACADAHGLYVEGLPPEKIHRMYPRGLPIYGLVKNVGLISDDTEHAAATAVAYIKSKGDPKQFEKQLAWEMKKWLWSLPCTIGWATLKSLVKLSLGVPAHKSGVSSAGNGPCMRAPILGALCVDLAQITELVCISTKITHTDQRCLDASIMIAYWTHLYKKHQVIPDLSQFLDAMSDFKGDVWDILQDVKHAVSIHQTPHDFCQAKGWKQGPTGYVVQTVAAAFMVLYTYEGHWENSVRNAVLLGGDTDSIAALVGGMLGAVQSPPNQWTSALQERPRSHDWLIKVEYAAQNHTNAPHLSFLSCLLRNVLFFPLVAGALIKRKLRW